MIKIGEINEKTTLFDSVKQMVNSINDNISINEFNRRLVEMQNSIADDYGLNVEIRLEEPSQISKTFLERELF